MSRIKNKFEELKSKGEKALIPYISLGDPSLEKSEEIILTLEKSGADIIELGIPYSDPVADGPVIEEASQRSLKNGFNLEKGFECIKNVRKKSDIPLVIMCYYNTIFGSGCEKFIKNCKEAEIDGIIVPDLPVDEHYELIPYIEGTGIDLIAMAALTSHERIPKITAAAQGFVYCVSSLGVTGERQGFSDRVDSFIEEVKKHSKCPVCVGFGISKKEDVQKFSKMADGVIVGSAIVRTIFETNCDAAKIGAFIKELKKGTR